MAEKTLTSAQIGEFCESMALLQSVGVTLPEAVHMLADGYGVESRQRAVMLELYRPLAEGESLAEAMKESGAFPIYASRMVRNGERTGHLEATLRSLSHYYDEQARLFDRVRTSVAYPCALLCVMSVVLAFCVIGILPVFSQVYETVAGGLSASSAGFVSAGIAIGWVALIVTLVLTLIALFVYAATRSDAGRERLLELAQKLPGMRNALYSIALSRFISTLAVYTASGSHVDEAMAAAAASVDHRELLGRIEPAYDAMVQPIRPLGLVQALTQNNVIDDLSGRMLEFGSRSGSIDDALERLADSTFEVGISRFDAIIDMVEPVLIALLTVAIGATLIAVMLPLVGILGAIG